MSNFQVAYFKNEKIYNRNIPSEVIVLLERYFIYSQL